MNTYYTPDVSEFCVGFTFEENWTKEDTWLTVIIRDAKELAYWMDTYAFDSTPENFRASINNWDNYNNIKKLQFEWIERKYNADKGEQVQNTY